MLSTPAKFFVRYIDDVLRAIKQTDLDKVFTAVNSLHQNVKFTTEKKENAYFAFLDMSIKHINNKLSLMELSLSLRILDLSRLIFNLSLLTAYTLNSIASVLVV